MFPVGVRYGNSSGPDQVAPPDLDAVEAELARRHVDEPLEHPVRDLGAEAAVGALLVLVRQHGSERVLDVLDPVRADDLGERVAVGARAELEVRAVVVDAVIRSALNSPSSSNASDAS